MLPSHSSSGTPVNSLRPVNTLEAGSSMKPSNYQSLEMVKRRRVQVLTKKSTTQDPRSLHLPMIPMDRMDRSNRWSSALKPRQRCKRCLNSNIVSARTQSLPYSRMEWEFMMNCALKYGPSQPLDRSLYLEQPRMESLRRKLEDRSSTCRRPEKGISNGDWYPIHAILSTWNRGPTEASYPILRSFLHQKRQNSHYPFHQPVPLISHPSTKPYPPCYPSRVSIRPCSQYPISTTRSCSKSRSTPRSIR